MKKKKLFIARASPTNRQKGTVLATVDTRLDAKLFRAGARCARVAVCAHICVSFNVRVRMSACNRGVFILYCYSVAFLGCVHVYIYMICSLKNYTTYNVFGFVCV